MIYYTKDISGYDATHSIVKNLESSKDILEFGANYGMLTKYLKEELNSNIWITELNMENGKANEFCEESLIGGEAGDVEKYHWLNYALYKEKKFDYILLIDKLATFKDPFFVLDQCKKVLKDNGSIFISIPNIAYSGVLIDLWDNNFIYKDKGILDITNLRFFTYKTFTAYIDSLGFKIVAQDNLINSLVNSEFYKETLNIPEEVFKAMSSRPFNEIYQFVFEIKVK